MSRPPGCYKDRPLHSHTSIGLRYNYDKDNLWTAFTAGSYPVVECKGHDPRDAINNLLLALENHLPATGSDDDPIRTKSNTLHISWK